MKLKKKKEQKKMQNILKISNMCESGVPERQDRENGTKASYKESRKVF